MINFAGALLIIGAVLLYAAVAGGVFVVGVWALWRAVVTGELHMWGLGAIITIVGVALVVYGVRLLRRSALWPQGY